MKYLFIMLILFSCSKPKQQTCWECQLKCQTAPRDTVICNEGERPSINPRDTAGNGCAWICKQQ